MLHPINGFQMVKFRQYLIEYNKEKCPFRFLVDIETYQNVFHGVEENIVNHVTMFYSTFDKVDPAIITVQYVGEVEGNWID